MRAPTMNPTAKSALPCLFNIHASSISFVVEPCHCQADGALVFSNTYSKKETIILTFLLSLV
jgi:hypothetical protein